MKWLNMTLIVLLILCSISLSNGQVQKIVGMNADSSVPPIIPIPCTTFGYSIEQSVILPGGFNGATLLRVSDISDTGWLLTDDMTVGSGSARLLAFNLSDLSTIGTFVIDTNATDWTGGQTWQGDIDGDTLYVVGRVRNGRLGCTATGGFDCIGVQRFNATGSRSALIIQGSEPVVNIDDARNDGHGGLLFVYGDITASRRLGRFSFSTLGIAVGGSNLGLGTAGIIKKPIGDFSYVMTNDVARTLFRVPVPSITQDGSISLATSLGGDLAGAIWSTNIGGSDLILIESDVTGGAQAERVYVDPGTFSVLTVSTYDVSGIDGGTASQGAHIDVTNNTIHSYRSTLTTNKIVRTSVPAPFTRFNVFTDSILNGTGGPTSFPVRQVSDFSQNRLRIYAVNSSSPGTLFKIKVCATGGP